MPQHDTSPQHISPVAGSRQTRRTPSEAENSPISLAPLPSSVVNHRGGSNGSKEAQEHQEAHAGKERKSHSHNGGSSERSGLTHNLRIGNKHAQLDGESPVAAIPRRLPPSSIIRRIVAADDAQVKLIQWAQDRPQLIERFKQIVADSEVAVFKGVFEPVDYRGAIILIDPIGVPLMQRSTCAVWECDLSPATIRAAIQESQERYQQAVSA